MKAAESKRAALEFVRMGEIHICRGREELSCGGVGSGIVVAAYDAESKIGACGHFILPGASDHLDRSDPAKFIDTGFPEVVDRMVAVGASRERIRVALAGASSLKSARPLGESADLAGRNLKAATEALEGQGFHCEAIDVGGQMARTVSLSTSDGEVRVETFAQPKRLLCTLRG